MTVQSVHVPLCTHVGLHENPTLQAYDCTVCLRCSVFQSASIMQRLHTDNDVKRKDSSSPLKTHSLDTRARQSRAMAQTTLLRWRMDVAVTLLMIVMQTSGTYRRLLDDKLCQGLPLAFAPLAYPCSSNAAVRLLFLMRNFPSTLLAWARAVSPWNAHLEGAAVGELWSFVMLTFLGAQLPMLLLVRGWSHIDGFVRNARVLAA